jgi:hypothetical protein
MDPDHLQLFQMEDVLFLFVSSPTRKLAVMETGKPFVNALRIISHNKVTERANDETS